MASIFIIANYRASLLGLEVGKPLEGDVQPVLTLGRNAKSGDCPVLEGSEVHAADYFGLFECPLQVVLVSQHKEGNPRKALIAEQIVELRPRDVDACCMGEDLLWS